MLPFLYFILFTQKKEAIRLSTGNNHLQEKVHTLQQQTKFYIQEIKEIIQKLPISKNTKLISYFTSTFNISHNLEQESLCLGSYVIHNIGNEPLTNLRICITLPENSPFSFSGRYVHEHFKPSFQGPNEWMRIKNTNKKNEFWLTPLSKKTLEPNEIFSFSNFQIKWSPNQSYAGSIIGYTYCDQLEDGVTVLNPINLSVITLSQEVEHE